MEKILQSHWRSRIKEKDRMGGIFDEAMLLGAKGLILIIIIAGFAVSVLSVISKFTALIETITQELPDY